MSTNNPIPEKVRNYNVYSGPTATQRLVGVSKEVALPELNFESEEISGAGILGRFESPNEGHVASITIEIPLRLITPESLDLAVGDVADLTLRAGTQSMAISSRKIVEQGLVINVQGPVKEIKPGKLVVGAPMDMSIVVEVLYYKIDRDDNGTLQSLLELDKLNFVYTVNGVDKLAGLRRYT